MYDSRAFEYCFVGDEAGVGTEVPFVNTSGIASFFRPGLFSAVFVVGVTTAFDSSTKHDEDTGSLQ